MGLDIFSTGGAGGGDATQAKEDTIIAALGTNKVISATVTTSTSSTAATFTGLIGSTVQFVGGIISPDTGAAAGDWAEILTFNSGTGAMTFTPLSAAPGTVVCSILPSKNLALDPTIAGIKTKTDVIPLRGTKSPTNIATGNLFTWTGTIQILAIVGRCTTAIQAQACTLRLGLIADALAEYFLCAASASVTGVHIGTAFSITGTLADAMVFTDLIANYISQTGTFGCTCTTSGVIHLTTSATSTGVIEWDVLWIPISPGATLVAA